MPSLRVDFFMPFLSALTLVFFSSSVDTLKFFMPRIVDSRAFRARQKCTFLDNISTGPGPGWGPVRVGARSGLGPIWAHMGPYVFC